MDRGFARVGLLLQIPQLVPPFLLRCRAPISRGRSSAGACRCWRRTMVLASPSLRDGSLLARGMPVLTAVPPNVSVSEAGAGAAYIGAAAAAPSSRHVFTLGVLEFKIWWMIPRVGKSGSDIPVETQLLLLEAREQAALEEAEGSSPSSLENNYYILFLPVLDGDFRSSLQGTPSNELQFCVESGDSDVRTSQVRESIFINSGDNPFELLRDSVKILAKQKQTFNHVENKKIPAHLDWFGWCTWDAFYTEVNPQGIVEGLQSLSQGGTPPRFLVIDDGWQDTVNEFVKEGEPHIDGTQFARRLVSIKENKKFNSSTSSLICHDFGNFIRAIKEEYGLRSVYLWHALAGYWGGVLPSSDQMKKYNPKLEYPVQSSGNVGNLRDIAMDSLEKYGVGLIDPDKILEFYDDQHSYLSSLGVDGVKVDVQNVIETLGSGHGGRVLLTRKYQQALEESISSNFTDNSIISCMCHNLDSIYSFRKSAVARVSEDFMPRESALQTLHIASVSYNSLLLGEIVVPDWDMFHSDHATAEFHGAARAVGGCGVYVSDKPGKHDFKILRKLVLPDGSVLRAKRAGLPTRDCLFIDPVSNGKSLLKIWNLNNYSGVIGIFNCQGAGTWQWPLQEQLAGVADISPISGLVSPSDIDYLDDLAGGIWSGDCAVFAFGSGCLSRLSKKGSLDISLGVLQCEVYTVSPIKEYGDLRVEFAPIGLTEMYNSGGAIQKLGSISVPNSGLVITIQAKGPGRFGAYSSISPRRCNIDSQDVEFSYHFESCLLTFQLSHASSNASCFRDISVVY